MKAAVIEREAAEIAIAIEQQKQRPYQADEKALVAEYVRATEQAGHRSFQVTLEALDLPWPVWALIRKTYLADAIDWKREKRI